MNGERTPWLPSMAAGLTATAIAYNADALGASLWACLALWLVVVAAMKIVMGVEPA